MRSSIKGVSPEWYTLESEVGADDPVQFYLQPLNGVAWTHVLMGSYNAETEEVDGSGITKAFRLGCKGWRNIEDGDHPGEQLPFSLKAIGSLYPAWIMEVGQEIMRISRLSEGDEKNSDSPSSSPET